MTDDTAHTARAAAALDDEYAALSRHLHGDGASSEAKDSRGAIDTAKERADTLALLDGITPGPWRLDHPSKVDGLFAGDRFLADFLYSTNQNGANPRLIASAPDLAADKLRLLDEIDLLRGLLWYAWNEFNAIRARSGSPLSHDGMPLVVEDFWDAMTEAFARAIGPDATKPWPSPEARDALTQGGKA